MMISTRRFLIQWCTWMLWFMAGALLTLYSAECRAFQVCWQAPTENTDGTPLTDLDRFKLYYGSAPRQYDRELTIEQAGDGCFNVRAPQGLWYVAMTAIDAEGNESAYSNEVQKQEGRLDGPSGGELLGPSDGTVITDEE